MKANRNLNLPTVAGQKISFGVKSGENSSGNFAMGAFKYNVYVMQFCDKMDLVKRHVVLQGRDKYTTFIFLYTTFLYKKLGN